MISTLLDSARRINRNRRAISLGNDALYVMMKGVGKCGRASPVLPLSRSCILAALHKARHC